MTRDSKARSRARKEKIRRQNRPNEIKARDRERNRISNQKRRMNESQEEKEARREKQKIMQRIARMNESQEARALRLETGRIRAKFRRLSESYDQRKIRLEKERVNARVKRLMESPEQRQERRRRDTLRQKEKRKKLKGELRNIGTYEENSSIILQPEIIHGVFGQNLFEAFPQQHQNNLFKEKSGTNEISNKLNIQQTNILLKTLKSNKIDFDINNACPGTIYYGSLETGQTEINPYLVLQPNNEVEIKEEICSSDDEESNLISSSLNSDQPSGYQRFLNKDRNFVSMDINMDKLKSKIEDKISLEKVNLSESREPSNFMNKLESHNSIHQYNKDILQKIQIIGEVENEKFIARLFKDLFIIDGKRLNEYSIEKKDSPTVPKENINIHPESLTKSNIIERMSNMDQPWICPHGHPTLKHFFNFSNI